MPCASRLRRPCRGIAVVTVTPCSHVPARGTILPKPGHRCRADIDQDATLSHGGGQSDDAWPDSWQWPLELTAHLLKRMIDRNFAETDLRAMLEAATGYGPDVEAGRWIIHTTHDRQKWHVIVEPDDLSQRLVVITAYAIG